MEIPIYYGFEDFEKNHLIRFVTYLQKIDEGILKIPKPTIIDYYKYLDEFYIEKINLLTGINSSDNSQDIQKIITEYFDKEQLNSFSHHLDFDYWDVNVEDLDNKTYYYSLRLKGNLNKISDYVQNKLFEYHLTDIIPKKDEKTVQSQPNKIPIKGSLQSIGFLFSELIEKGFIEAPKRNGKDNTSAISRMILEHFEFIDKEDQPKPEDIRKTLFLENKLSAEKQKLFKIPESKIINTD